MAETYPHLEYRETGDGLSFDVARAVRITEERGWPPAAPAQPRELLGSSGG